MIYVRYKEARIVCVHLMKGARKFEVERLYLQNSLNMESKVHKNPVYILPFILYFLYLGTFTHYPFC